MQYVHVTNLSRLGVILRTLFLFQLCPFVQPHPTPTAFDLHRRLGQNRPLRLKGIKIRRADLERHQRLQGTRPGLPTNWRSTTALVCLDGPWPEHQTLEARHTLTVVRETPADASARSTAHLLRATRMSIKYEYARGVEAWRRGGIRIHRRHLAPKCVCACVFVRV